MYWLVMYTLMGNFLPTNNPQNIFIPSRGHWHVQAFTLLIRYHCFGGSGVADTNSMQNVSISPYIKWFLLNLLTFLPDFFLAASQFFSETGCVKPKVINVFFSALKYLDYCFN